MVKNFKPLLMKTIENFIGKAIGEILSSINENLGGSYSVVERAWSN